jgi:RNA polymerase sigma-70 factor (ECF subfamily)
VENARYVNHCLDELKSNHRQVVYLTFFEGRSYPEIANILQIPAGTVKTRMMHAKKQLMNCLTRLTNRGRVEEILGKKGLMV